MAGGTGKSICFGSLPEFAEEGKRTLLTVHTKELVNQAAAHLKRWNPGVTVGVEMADQITSGEQIIVASIQTIGRNLGARLGKFNPDDFSWVICDEAHRSLAETYTTVFDHFGLFDADKPGATLVGFTATPRRGDNVPLGSVYEEIVFSYGIEEAIRDGWLSDVRGIRVKTTTDLSKVGQQNGDFKQEELSATVNNPARNKQIVEAWIKEAYPRRTIGFTVTVQHAKDLAFEFQKAGVPAEAIWGDDPHRERKIAQHRSGVLSILLCSQLLVEGYDDPEVSCVIMCRPTKSSTYFIQATVRGTRLGPGIDNLVQWIKEGRLKPGDKRDMLLLDICDTTTKHSLITLPTLFGLGPNLDLKGGSVMEAAHTLAQVQAKYPDIDLSKLDDITKLKTYIEEAYLFRVDFCSEITEASELCWHKMGHNKYRLLLPAREQVTITGDALGLFTVTGVVVQQNVAGAGFKSLPEALAYAEKHVSQHGRSLLTLLRRESGWHKHPVSEGQLKQLKILKVPAHHIAKMDKGLAAKYITKRFGSRR